MQRKILNVSNATVLHCLYWIEVGLLFLVVLEHV